MGVVSKGITSLGKFLPTAMRKTPTDEYLKLQKNLPAGDLHQLEKLGALVEAESARLSSEIQNITHKLRMHNALQEAGGHSAESAAKVIADTKEAFRKLESQKKNIFEMLDILHNQGQVVGAKEMVNMAASMNYEVEKKMGLLKGLLVGTGAGTGGILLEKALRAGEPEAAVEEMEGPDEAVGKMNGAGWGENTANFLMDWVSPIPRKERRLRR